MSTNEPKGINAMFQEQPPEQPAKSWKLNPLEDLPKDGTRVWMIDSNLAGFVGVIDTWWNAEKEAFVTEFPGLGEVAADMSLATRRAGWVYVPEGWE
jgi:hypothetical protein